jgi:2-oxoglutarate ferredoxin oxidoreductase subunit delta
LAKITIDEARCKSCSYCVVSCPKKLIEIRDSINQLGYNPAYFPQERDDDCTSCTLCAQMCPEVLITVYKEEKTS